LQVLTRATTTSSPLTAAVSEHPRGPTRREKDMEAPSMVPTWAFPLMGVIAMFSFASFVGMQRRARTTTRQVNIVQPVLDEESFLSEFDAAVE